MKKYQTICGKCGNRYKHKKDCPINIVEVLNRKRPQNVLQWLFIQYWKNQLIH